MTFRLYLNNKLLWMDDEKFSCPSPSNPHYCLELYLPRISIAKRKHENFDSDYVTSEISIGTGVGFTYYTDNEYYNFYLILFGFGFSISKQTGY